MAEIIMYVLQALFIIFSASLVGYPLYRANYSEPSDSVDLIRLVCFSFGFGTVMLFFIAFVLSYAPFGQRGLAIISTTILPAIILFRYRRDIAPVIALKKSLFYIWIAFCFFILFLCASILEISSYPGLFSDLVAGLIDHIEYSSLAHRLFTDNEYTTRYFILDFANNLEELKQSAQNHQLSNHVVNRLPFTPYLTFLYMNVFSFSAENIAHNVFSLLLVTYSALLSGMFFCWAVSVNKEALGAGKQKHYTVYFLIIAFLYIAFSTEFLIGCLEIISLYYFLLLLESFSIRHPPDRSGILALFLSLAALFFNKGEGTAFIASFMLVMYAPKAVGHMLKHGIKAALPYAVAVLLFAAVISPLVLTLIKINTANNMSFRIYQIDCENKGLQLNHAWFLKYIEDKFHISLDKCGAKLDLLTEDELEEYAYEQSHLDDYEKFILAEHLEYLKKFRRNGYLFSYMLGTQVDFSRPPPSGLNNEADRGGDYFVLLVKLNFKLMVKAISNAIVYIGWAIPWSNWLILLAYMAGGFTRNLVFCWVAGVLTLVAAYLHPRKLIPYLILFVLFEAIVVTLNATSITFSRFMMLLTPIMILVFTLIGNSVKLPAFLTWSRAGRLCFTTIVISLTIFNLALRTGELRAFKTNDSYFGLISKIILENTEPDSIIVSSFPMVITGMTGRQSIGHSRNFLYLSELIDSFNPEYILFYDRPDLAGKGYSKQYDPNRDVDILKEYKPVIEDRARKFILLKSAHAP